MPSALVLGAAAVTGVVCWYFGTDVWHALMTGAAVAAAGLVWVALPEQPITRWRGIQRAPHEGTRQDVLQLSWSVRPRYGRVRDSALRRVQELARSRLALHHLDLLDPRDRPEIERRLGRTAYATLRSTGRRPPFLWSVVRCLDALDRLDPPRHTEETPR